MPRIAESALSDSAVAAANAADISIQQFTAMDWDFKESRNNPHTPHNFHPYPAKFIAEIPAQLIKLFAPPGGTVYDPFIGCGTTCVEANLLGCNALGNDVNELSVLLSKVKTTPLPEKENEQVRKTVTDSLQLIASGHVALDIPVKSIAWYSDIAANEISAIKASIAKVTDDSARDFCHIALSAILVSVSKQDSDTRYTRVNKTLSPGETIKRYERQLNRMITIMDIARDRLSKNTSHIELADSRTAGVFADNSADIGITSPPYPNAYDYHLYHKHRMFWLGMDPMELKKKEIGAHAHYSRKNGLNENDFYNDMEMVLAAASRVLKKNAYFAIVVGNSILHGRKICNSELISRAGIKTGFTEVMKITRNLNTRKKSFNPAYGKINQEDILLLRNDKKN